jgi:hypothetical protein
MPGSTTSPSRTSGSPAMPKRRPTNRLSECTPQWLALLIEMRLLTPKEAHEAHLRAVKQHAEDEGSTTPEPPPTRRRRGKNRD